jgi:hypothetical protein
LTLADNVHRLTSEHLTMHDGTPTKASALLDRLKDACTSNLGAQGGGSGGAGLPINTAAVDLDRAIRAEALANHYEMHATEYRGSLRGLIRMWARTLPTPQWEEYLDKVTLGWCDQIEALMVQKRPPFRPSAPCPACGLRFFGPDNTPTLNVIYWDDENERVLPQDDWCAGCENCGAAWGGVEEMKFLQHAIDTPTERGSVA